MTPHTPPPNAQQRFSDRVANYVRYRPGYPAGVIAVLTELAGFRPGSRVADLGSGTGISAALLLHAGAEVFAVEPNAEMRQSAEAQLQSQPGFHSIAASAEATGLPTHTLDLVIAAQAFHWFDRAKVRQECSRLLTPEGHIALIWNVRKTDATPFLRDYETLLLTYATDYAQVRHENVDPAALHAFFLGGTFEKRVLPNEQCFDFDGLQGRLLSSSYAPAPGHERHEPMLTELRRLFDQHQADGVVRLLYDTEIYVGK